jgi:hypothetical protein
MVNKMNDEKYVDKPPKWYKKWREKDAWEKTDSNGYLDHVRYNDKDEVISEPYDCTMDDIECLIRTCKQMNWEFDICGESVHNPGRTFRITIWESKKE